MKTLMLWARYALVACATLLALLAGYIFVSVASFDTQTLPEHHGLVAGRLFLADGPRQPLVVAFGGAEGGDAWAGPHGGSQRALLHANGYALLTVAYFGSPGTPAALDRVAIDGVHRAVLEAAQDPQINENCISVMGVSRGSELALLLGSHYATYRGIIAIVPGSSVFAAITNAMTTSGFSHHGVALPFVPVPWSATLDLITGDRLGVFRKAMANSAAMEAAAIPVERSTGPIFLLSSTEDEEWPSEAMADRLVERLQQHRFAHPFEHVALVGGHSEHHDHFDKVTNFLNAQVLSQPGCRNTAARQPSAAPPNDAR